MAKRPKYYTLDGRPAGRPQCASLAGVFWPDGDVARFTRIGPGAGAAVVLQVGRVKQPTLEL